MKALNLGRPELQILEGALNLAVDMMEAHSARIPNDRRYLETIEDYRKLARQIESLVQYGDAAQAAGESVTAAGFEMRLPCPTCKKM